MRSQRPFQFDVLRTRSSIPTINRHVLFCFLFFFKAVIHFTIHTDHILIPHVLSPPSLFLSHSTALYFLSCMFLLCDRSRLFASKSLSIKFAHSKVIHLCLQHYNIHISTTHLYVYIYCLLYICTYVV